jgi:hypothetical protein
MWNSGITIQTSSVIPCAFNESIHSSWVTRKNGFQWQGIHRKRWLTKILISECKINHLEKKIHFCGLSKKLTRGFSFISMSVSLSKNVGFLSRDQFLFPIFSCESLFIVTHFERATENWYATYKSIQSGGSCCSISAFPSFFKASSINQIDQTVGPVYKEINIRKRRPCWWGVPLDERIWDQTRHRAMRAEIEVFSFCTYFWLMKMNSGNYGTYSIPTFPCSKYCGCRLVLSGCVNLLTSRRGSSFWCPNCFSHSFLRSIYDVELDW